MSKCDTMGFIRHHMIYSSVWVSPITGYGVCRFRYGMEKADPGVTHGKPYPSSYTMNFYYPCLLLLLVLNTYSKSSQYVKPPDPFVVTLPNSSSTLVSLALVLPQSEVFGFVLPQNGAFKMLLPQNEVLKTILPHNKVMLAQIKCFKWEFFKKVQNIVSKLNSVMTQSIKSFRKLMFPLVHGRKTYLWAIRIAPECFQHILKMYA